MGISVHSLMLLRQARMSKPFGATLTLGRQKLYVQEEELRRILPDMLQIEPDAFCESLFASAFAATSVDSIDNSDYESATLLHDMNLPVPVQLAGKFDTLYDGGTLEHVFNVSQAFENCVQLVRTGGQIIHVSPASNFCGHGLWQFSPELFFSLYSEQNGFAETTVYLARMNDHKKWFKVIKPQMGWRMQFTADEQVCVLVRTVKVADMAGKKLKVFQSDYEHAWNAADTPRGEGSAGGRKRKRFGKSLLRRLGWKGRNGLNSRNPWLLKVDPLSPV